MTASQKRPCQQSLFTLFVVVRSQLIRNYIVMGMKAQLTVEEPDFKALVTGLSKLNSDVTVMSRRTLGRRVDDLEQTMVQKLKQVLSVPTYVYTTADIWSANRRSFLGVTVHWTSDALQRTPAALACKRFSGSHTYERIADLLTDVLAQFGLSEKVR